LTHSLTLSSRLRVAVLAGAFAGLSFGAALVPFTASAQTGAYYTATLEQPAQDSRTVAGGVAWMCQGTTCIANKGTARPVRVCRGLARKFGEITSFRTEGEDLADNRLAQCNGR
jgi:hypothetical protein